MVDAGSTYFSIDNYSKVAGCSRKYFACKPSWCLLQRKKSRLGGKGRLTACLKVLQQQVKCRSHFIPADRCLAKYENGGLLTKRIKDSHSHTLPPSRYKHPLLEEGCYHAPVNIKSISKTFYRLFFCTMKSSNTNCKVTATSLSAYRFSVHDPFKMSGKTCPNWPEFTHTYLLKSLFIQLHKQ